MKRLLYFLTFSNIILAQNDPQFMPTKCEICALTAIEFHNQASRISKRVTSEFISLSEEICNGMNELKIHKEKTGVERFSRQPSETMNTLKQMRARGVDIQLGLPFEMWDAPSAEVTALRQGCETIIEEYEDVLEDWFLHKEKLDHLLIRLCKQEYLKGTNMECLPVSKPLRTEF